MNFPFFVNRAAKFEDLYSFHAETVFSSFICTKIKGFKNKFKLCFWSADWFQVCSQDFKNI